MGLLRAAWIAGTLPILIASLPCSWLGSFHGLVLGFARRGKIMQSSSHRVSSEFFFFFLELQDLFKLCEIDSFVGFSLVGSFSYVLLVFRKGNTIHIV